MTKINELLSQYFGRMALPDVGITDIIEILILGFLVYHIVKWIKKTKAWVLVKGLAVLLVAWLLAYIFEFHVILWIFANTITVGITALIILFQPEFRKALEQLGQRNVISPIFNFKDNGTELFSDKTLEELTRATFELARTKTGALIVIERDVSLSDYEKTGIAIDAIVSSELLINIFEHNTPLHDGAVIIRKNRATAATCYLPLSDNMRLSKALGTRHRAGIGISEVTDSFTIIVSEETGKVSFAQSGELYRHITMDNFQARLREIQNKKTVESTTIKRLLTKTRKNIKADKSYGTKK